MTTTFPGELSSHAFNRRLESRVEQAQVHKPLFIGLALNTNAAMPDSAGRRSVVSLLWWAILLAVLIDAPTLSADMAELPLLDAAELSPDGRHLLSLRSNGETYELAVRSTPDGEDRIILSADRMTGLLNWCHWATSERILCSKRHGYRMARVGRVIATRLFAINRDGSGFLELDMRVRNLVGRAQQFTPQIQDRVVSWLQSDERSVLVQLNRMHPNRPSVYRLDIVDGSLTRERKFRSQIRHWYADHDGVIRLGVGFRTGDIPVVYRIGRFPSAYENPAFESEVPPVPLGFSADGSEVYMNMTHGTDRHGIYRVRYADGEVLGPVWTDPQFDVFGSLVQDPDTGRPVGVRYMRHHLHTEWFDPELRELFSRLESLVPGQHNQLVSVDDGRNWYLFHAYGGISPGWFLVERATGAVTGIARDFPSLQDEAVTETEPMAYPSRDGTMIPGYLTLPKAPFKPPYATVILPHGGPYDRDSARFDDWVQFMTGRGIAVLKPNYRGSVGYGELFMRAGYREWGKRMQDDLLDGVDWLVKAGVTDPDRVCVVGASYGGYTALVAAWRFADRFRCSVSFGGISDLELMVRRIHDFDLVQRNRDRVQSGPELREHSPLQHADDFRLPVLIVHGDEDAVVDVGQSRALAKALHSAGRNFEYLEQEGGDHFLSTGGQRREFFGRLGRFLDAELKPASGEIADNRRRGITPVPAGAQ